LYFARTDRSNGFIGEKLIGEPCCQCCRTDLFVDSRGNIHALYRGIIEDSIRDMLHIVSTDGGNTFSKPARISNDNWVINGCPHTGPAMSETNDALQFAWYTGGKNKGCYYTQSADNGATFLPRSPVSESGSHPQLTSIGKNAIALVWEETVVTNKQVNKRIGVQVRNENLPAVTQLITSENKTATYPVIISISENSAIVAYTIKKNDKNYVEYQVVKYR
jgi:hypothetical protein